MRDDVLSFSPPKWRLTRWLAAPGAPDDVRRALVASPFETLPIYVGGALNGVLIAALLAYRVPEPPFLAWLVVEAAICAARLLVLAASMRSAGRGRSTPSDPYIALGVCAAASAGYGAFISLVGGDWAAATLACLAAATAVGGACFGAFGAPRLFAVLTLLSLGPICLAAPFSGEPALIVTVVQIPLYLIGLWIAADRLTARLGAAIRAERETDHQARHDPLTGLANRAGLMRAVDETGSRRLALLYLDLDGFKSVNDAHGHAAGDRLLKSAAERLRHMLRTGDVAARMGGDEFVIVARNIDRAQAAAFGERLIRELGAAYDIAPRVAVSIGVSVGVALTPDHGDDVSELLAVADAALYSAKSLGKSRCVVAPPGSARDGGRDVATA